MERLKGGSERNDFIPYSSYCISKKRLHTHLLLHRRRFLLFFCFFFRLLQIVHSDSLPLDDSVYPTHLADVIIIIIIVIIIMIVVVG